MAALASWLVIPPLHGSYVPDQNLSPIWTSSDDEPAEGPNWSDYDNDGLPTWFEEAVGLDSYGYDTDLDGINDGDELFTTGTNPFTWDINDNSISDLTEFLESSDPSP